jgi:hypothetical protein
MLYLLTLQCSYMFAIFRSQGGLVASMAPNTAQMHFSIKLKINYLTDNFWFNKQLCMHKKIPLNLLENFVNLPLHFWILRRYIYRTT